MRVCQESCSPPSVTIVPAWWRLFPRLWLPTVATGSAARWPNWAGKFAGIVVVGPRRTRRPADPGPSFARRAARGLGASGRGRGRAARRGPDDRPARHRPARIVHEVSAVLHRHRCRSRPSRQRHGRPHGRRSVVRGAHRHRPGPTRTTAMRRSERLADELLVDIAVGQ